MTTVERWRLPRTGGDHQVAITDSGIRREIVWTIADAEVDRVKTSDEKVVLRGEGQAVAVRLPTFVGPARRVTVFDAESTDEAVGRAQVGLGGDDFVPEPGSKAAKREEWIRAHPKTYQFLAVGTAAAKVVAPLIVAALLAVVAVDIPWPDWNLPSIPWPDIPWPSILLPDWSLPDWRLPGWVSWVAERSKYVVPILIAWALAAGEIRRRKAQDAKREAAQHPD